MVENLFSMLWNFLRLKVKYFKFEGYAQLSTRRAFLKPAEQNVGFLKDINRGLA